MPNNNAYLVHFACERWCENNLQSLRSLELPVKEPKKDTQDAVEITQEQSTELQKNATKKGILKELETNHLIRVK